MSIEWTDETITAEFRKHIDYWRAKLRLLDMDVRIVMSTSGGSEWCRIRPDNAGSNRSRAVLEIMRDMLGGITRRDVWETCAHELVHAMNWSMAHAFDALTDHFSVAQLNMAKTLMKEGNELLAYKWEAILADWFKADAPID